MPELPHQLAQGAVLKPKQVGHSTLRAALDKHGAKRLVPTLIEIDWSREELSEAGVIHDQHSLEMSLGTARQTKGNRKINRLEKRRKLCSADQKRPAHDYRGLEI